MKGVGVQSDGRDASIKMQACPCHEVLWDELSTEAMPMRTPNFPVQSLCQVRIAILYSRIM